MPSPRYLLEKKGACFNDLKWRLCFINAGYTAPGLILALAENKQWRENIDGLYPQLITYVNQDKHRIIIVPASGRIEIRIHYSTAESERSVAAHQIAEFLATLVFAKKAS